MRNDRSLFRRALELSLLLHLLVIFLILPRVRGLWPTTSKVAEAMTIKPQAADDSKPLNFELVDLPNQREEKPENERPPLSDLDRKAHGGEGESPARRPGVRGSTPELVQSEGGQRMGRGVPPTRQGRPVPQVPQPSESDAREKQQPAVRRPAPEGAGQEAPQEPQRQPAIRLPEPGAWSRPPDVGGLPESPDRNGGVVDTGPLSFDTQWYDWGPYAAAMLRKIRRNWMIPEIAKLGVQGVVKVRFFIERDGTVSGLRIVDESGKPPMDFSARDAIASSSAFDPLPSDLTGVDREGITITFYYNTRPPDWGGS